VEGPGVSHRNALTNASTRYAAIVRKEADLDVAECPKVGSVSQGKTIEAAVANLQEATELYMKEFCPSRHG